jgi:hypothetical protein
VKVDTMTTAEFSAFIGAMREEMARAGMEPEDLELDESGHQARLPGVREPWFDIQREHLDAMDVTPPEKARAVMGVYSEDR